MKRIVTLALAIIMTVSLFDTSYIVQASEPIIESEEYAKRPDIVDAFGEGADQIKNTRTISADYRTWEQANSAWGSIKLGNSSYTMKSSGCLVTSITKLIIQSGFKSSTSFTPATLVNWLNQNGGFINGSLYWAKPAQYVSGFTYVGNLMSSGTYNSANYNSKIINWINAGYHMVIQVRGGGHWVAVDEAKTLATGEVYIMDSLPSSANADITLKSRYSTFNRITAYKGGETPSAGTTVNSDVYRIYGATRYETSYETADALKKEQGVEKFETVIVASGDSFVDALAGSYLAYKKNAPILLTKPGRAEELKTYINQNLTDDGIIYVLGGTGAVPDSAIKGLEGYNIQRLEGIDRYETNLAILREAGVTDEEFIVCTGANFADSLSASATGKPIFLVRETLTENQKIYLNDYVGNDFVVIGGPTVVSEQIQTELTLYDTEVERLYGATRYETSVLIAEQLLDNSNPEAAVVAYGANFPDGLCGGPLAASKKGPLLLAASGKESAATTYTNGKGIKKGAVLGGKTLVSDSIAKAIFSVNNIAVW